MSEPPVSTSVVRADHVTYSALSPVFGLSVPGGSVAGAAIAGGGVYA